MGRFSDWSPAGQPGDPTPGDTFGVRRLASRWDQVASVAADVQTTVERVQSASGSGVWVGQAGDVFRDKLGDFPTQVWQVRDSFSQSRDALNWWASMMEAHQSTADQGLAAAVAAQADLASAEASLASAQTQQQSAHSEYSRQNRVFQQWGSAPADQVPQGLSVPSGSVVRSLYRQQQDAANQVESASSQVGDAQSRLDAARRLVAQAKQSYQEDAHTTAGRLQAATDSAIPKDSWWEKLTNSDAWKVLVTIATVVVVVAAVAGLFLSGPAGWIAAGIAFGAGALLTANDIADFAKGNMSLGEFVVSMGLNFIPGGAIAKGGKALAKGVGAIAHGAGRVAAASGRVGRAATHAADAVVAGSKKTWSTAHHLGDRVSAASQRAWDGAKRSVRNDPIYQSVLSSGRRAIDNATDLLARAGGRPSLAHAGAGAEGSVSRVVGDLHDGVHARQATLPSHETGTGSHGHGAGEASSASDTSTGGTHAGPHEDVSRGGAADEPQFGQRANEGAQNDARFTREDPTGHTPGQTHTPSQDATHHGSEASNSSETARDSTNTPAATEDSVRPADGDVHEDGGIGDGQPSPHTISDGTGISDGSAHTHDGAAANQPDSLGASRGSTEVITDGSHINPDGSLKPNVTYKTGEFDYQYTTDENGYISHFHADELHLTDRSERLKHDPDVPGKLPGDHAGHLAGDRFGGSPHLDNLVAQLEHVNLSEYKRIENEWARSFEPGADGTIRPVKNIDVRIETDNATGRPTRFTVQYEIGEEIKKVRIRNQ